MDCNFCRIAAGELPAGIVLEDGESIAFLDRRPVFPGHVLLIPKRHIETLSDLPDELIGPLFGNSRRIARAVERALGAEGSFIAINNRVSQSMPHLHIHIIPRRRKDGLKGFFWPRQAYRDEAHLAEVRDALQRVIQEQDSGI